jgi:hypothetical protein
MWSSVRPKFVHVESSHSAAIADQSNCQGLNAFLNIIDWNSILPLNFNQIHIYGDYTLMVHVESSHSAAGDFEKVDGSTAEFVHVESSHSAVAELSTCQGLNAFLKIIDWSSILPLNFNPISICGDYTLMMDELKWKGPTEIKCLVSELSPLLTEIRFENLDLVHDA